MKRVFHFVPTMDIGGVEVAIEKALPDIGKTIELSIFYTKSQGSLMVGQRPWWAALKHIFCGRPDMVVTSLWWAHPLGFLFKLAGIKWVCFIHNSQFAHWVDRLVSTLSIICADVIAADSEQAAVFVRTIKKNIPNVHVIPYIFPVQSQQANVERVKNSFIFVGRNAKEKRIDLVLELFRHLLDEFPFVKCRFVFAGDVPREAEYLSESFGKRVIVEANLTNSEVLHRLFASEYMVLLSDFEGFCMVAYEAVQAGCFVIYRDVGEIRNYVLPEQSFRIEGLENLHKQIDTILIGRNGAAPNCALDARGGLQNQFEDTYVSQFIAMVVMELY